MYSSSKSNQSVCHDYQRPLYYSIKAHDLKLQGLNPAITGTGREKIYEKSLIRLDVYGHKFMTP